MNDIEAIHAIEVMLAEEEICGCFDFAPIELAALSHAIASLKARSDAEVVCEWLSVPSRKIVHHVEQPRNYSATYESLNESYTITCPTLADLAKKIGEMK